MLSSYLLRRAAEAYGNQQGCEVVLHEVKEFRAGRVVRCTVEASSAVDDTVVVKAAEDVTGSRRGMAAIRNEHAALTFLRRLGSTSSARLLADDIDCGLLIIEDLGDAPSLAHVLLYGSRSAAERATQAHARWLGTLHAETVGQFEAYEAIREQLDLRDAPNRFVLRGRDVRDCVKSLPELLAGIGLPTLRADSDLETVLAELDDPGDLLALSTGDPCPGNDAVFETGVRCFDLEAAGFRHALLDAAHYAVPFPNCWCWRQLPGGISGSMIEAHRRQLARTSTQAADEARYFVALIRAAAAWILWTLDQRLPDLDSSTNAATRVVRSLDNFADLARAHGELLALAGECENVADVIRSRWRVVPPVTYPALGGPMWTGS